MFSAEARGELPKGTARRWAHHTPDMKSLPEHVDDKEEKKADGLGTPPSRSALQSSTSLTGPVIQPGPGVSLPIGNIQGAISKSAPATPPLPFAGPNMRQTIEKKAITDDAAYSAAGSLAAALPAGGASLGALLGMTKGNRRGDAASGALTGGFRGGLTGTGIGLGGLAGGLGGVALGNYLNPGNHDAAGLAGALGGLAGGVGGGLGGYGLAGSILGKRPDEVAAEKPKEDKKPEATEKKAFAPGLPSKLPSGTPDLAESSTIADALGQGAAGLHGVRDVAGGLGHAGARLAAGMPLFHPDDLPKGGPPPQPSFLDQAMPYAGAGLGGLAGGAAGLMAGGPGHGLASGLGAALGGGLGQHLGQGMSPYAQAAMAAGGAGLGGLAGYGGASMLSGDEEEERKKRMAGRKAAGDDLLQRPDLTGRQHFTPGSPGANEFADLGAGRPLSPGRRYSLRDWTRRLDTGRTYYPRQSPAETAKFQAETGRRLDQTTPSLAAQAQQWLHPTPEQRVWQAGGAPRMATELGGTIGAGLEGVSNVLSGLKKSFGPVSIPTLGELTKKSSDTASMKPINAAVGSAAPPKMVTPSAQTLKYAPVPPPVVKQASVALIAATVMGIRQTALDRFDRLLSKAANDLPQAQRWPVRAMQASLARGMPLSRAIRDAYPGLSGEERGMYAYKLACAL